ncbi:AMP phosphorylase [Candidatus Woesearchaeota archaeon]|nr:AMP phosphorylase [Candidatus Woesearchaeota archaeon]
MKLKAQVKRYETGGPLVSVLSASDAQLLDLHVGDRIRLTKGRNEATAIVDIARSAGVRTGTVIVFDETAKKLGCASGDALTITLQNKPASVGYIRKKLAGKTLSNQQIGEIVQDIVRNRLDSVEATYFVAGCFTRGMSMRETIALTNSMVRYGEILRLDERPVIDKHCIGGVPGNRTTMVMVPIIAAAGLTIPKTSSRSITSPAGTADTMEVLAPVAFPVDQLKRIVGKHKGCIVWGGAMNLAGADDILIHLRHPLSLDPQGMLLASIMAKKKSVSATHILIDIPVGHGAKIERKREALALKKQFLTLAKELRMKAKVILTDGSQPIGNGLGPALEARDVLYVLQNHPAAPRDLREKSLLMAGLVFEMAKAVKRGMGYDLALGILDNGEAWLKMKAIIEAQGGTVTDPRQIRLGRYSKDVCATRPGTVRSFENRIIAKTARIAGAPEDKEAGIYLRKRVGDQVRKGEPLFTIYSDSKEKIRFAMEYYQQNQGIILRNRSH